jgi:PAS domain S-box-containing protein
MLLLALFIWWNAAALDRIARENGRFAQAVQDARTALLEILRHVDNAAFAHDLQGNLTFFNSAAEHLFGIPAAEALRRNIYAVITPQSAATAQAILSSELIGGERRPEPLVLRTSAGEQECAVLTIMMYDQDCNPAEFVSLVSPLFTATAENKSRLLPSPIHYDGAAVCMDLAAVASYAIPRTPDKPVAGPRAGGNEPMGVSI